MISIEQLPVYTIMFLISRCKKFVIPLLVGPRYIFYAHRTANAMFTIDPANQYGLKHWFTRCRSAAVAVTCAETRSHSRRPGNIRVSFTTGAVRSAILATAGLLAYNYICCFFTFLQMSHSNRVCILSHVRDHTLENYLGHDIDFSRSRDVIDDVIIRSAIGLSY